MTHSPSVDLGGGGGGGGAEVLRWTPAVGAAVDSQISTMSTSVGTRLAGFMRGPESPQ